LNNLGPKNKPVLGVGRLAIAGATQNAQLVLKKCGQARQTSLRNLSRKEVCKSLSVSLQRSLKGKAQTLNATPNLTRQRKESVSTGPVGTDIASMAMLAALSMKGLKGAKEEERERQLLSLRNRLPRKRGRVRRKRRVEKWLPP
jgi:hypothetical protein